MEYRGRQININSSSTFKFQEKRGGQRLRSLIASKKIKMDKTKLVTIISWSLLVVGIPLLFLYASLGIISILISIIFFVISHYQSKKASNKNTSEHGKIITLIQESSCSSKKLESLKNLLKKKNIDVKRVISKFDSPVWSIFVYKFGEQPRYSKVKLPKIFSEHITKNLKFELVGNSFYFLPPNEMPQIDEHFDIEKWTKKNIIQKLSKKIPYNIKWIALVDIRNVFAYKTTSYGETFFDTLLKKDRIFLEKLLGSLESKNIAIKQIVSDWELSDIITLKTESKITIKIKRNNKKIMEKLNCRKPHELADVERKLLKTKLEEVLKNVISDELLDNIKENAQALKEIQ